MDVHKRLYVLTVLTELDDGTVAKHPRAFGGFQRDRRALVAWWLELGVTLVVMAPGATGKAPTPHWSRRGFPSTGSMPGTSRTCPGAKPISPIPHGSPNWGGSAWSNRASSRPKTFANRAWFRAIGSNWPKPFAGETNRLHQVLDDAGSKLGSVVSDIHGVSAQAIIDGLIAGTPIQELPKWVQGALRNKREDLELSLEGELSARHRVVLQHLQRHIQTLETELAQLDRYLIEAMTP